MSLYELSVEVKRIENEWDELEEGAAPEAALALLSKLDAVYPDVQDKFVACMHFSKNLASEAEAIDAEIKRLQARKKARENKVEAVRNYLLYCMRILELKSIKTPTFTFTRNKPRERVEVDESQVWQWPAEAAKDCCQVVYNVRKTDLKNIPNWRELPGVSVVDGEESLTVR